MENEALSTSELERSLFKDARAVKVEIEILEEQHQDLVRVCTRNKWSVREGYRVALTTGLGKLRADLLEGESEEQLGLTERLMHLESLYAVMKFNAFHLMKDNQTLELQNAALRNTVSALEGALRRVQDENSGLRIRLGEKPSDSAGPLIEKVPTSLSGIRVPAKQSGARGSILSRLGLAKKSG